MGWREDTTPCDLSLIIKFEFKDQAEILPEHPLEGMSIIFHICTENNH